jgi:hypothetical protein
MRVLAESWRKTVYGALFFFLLSSILSCYFLGGGEPLIVSYWIVAVGFWISLFLVARRIRQPSRDLRSLVTVAPLLLFGTVFLWFIVIVWS